MMNNMPNEHKVMKCSGRAKQTGLTLFTALIFLIMLSLLGVNAAQMSGLEERMAGNTRNRDLAFQAAEATLRYAETNLSTIATKLPAPANVTSGTVASAGLRAINDCLPNSASYWNGTGDTDCNNTKQAITLNSNGSGAWDSSVALSADASAVPLGSVLAAQPMYIVERYPNSHDSSGGTQQNYRVTTQGVGGEASAVVILQAKYCVPTLGATCTN